MKDIIAEEEKLREEEGKEKGGDSGEEEEEAGRQTKLLDFHKQMIEERRVEGKKN